MQNVLVKRGLINWSKVNNQIIVLLGSYFDFALFNIEIFAFQNKVENQKGIFKIILYS
jgi:hypothetical protein